MHLIICGNKLNKMIPTAEEFLDKKYGVFTDDRTGEKFADCVTPNDLIEFAKLHVEEALKEAYQKSMIHTRGIYDDRINTLSDEGISLYKGDPYFGEYSSVYVKIDKDSILNAYPLENIK